MTKEEKTKKYNERMALRLHPNTSAGKAPRASNLQPQVRKPSTKVNKGEEFVKKSNFNKQLVGKPVSGAEYFKVNKQGTLERYNPKVKMTKKQRREARHDRA